MSSSLVKAIRPLLFGEALQNKRVLLAGIEGRINFALGNGSKEKSIITAAIFHLTESIGSILLFISDMVKHGRLLPKLPT